MERGCLSVEEVRSAHRKKKKKVGKQGMGEGRILESWKLVVDS